MGQKIYFNPSRVQFPAACGVQKKKLRQDTPLLAAGWFIFVNVRKYLMEDRETGKRAVVSVTNRNALSVERYMELLSLNDEEHIYLECVEAILIIYSREQRAK